jgi:hypothetical protein
MTRIYARIFLCVAISAPISAIAQEAYQDRATADLDNRLVEAPDLRIYLIKNGHRSLILNPAWIGAIDYASQQPIRVSQTKIQSLPFGPDLT